MAGMTLIEALIVVTVIGIIASIAIPAYDSYVKRGNRTVAKTVLSEIASRQESWLVDRKSYATTLTALGYPADVFYVAQDGRTSATSSNAIYSVTLTAATATSFTATATARGGQAKDTGCTTLTLDNLGNKGPPSSNCWVR